MDKNLFQKLLGISLALILIGGLLAYFIQTDFGKVTVKDVRFAAPNGRMYSALLYIPNGVSVEAPAPGILAIHGYINSRAWLQRGTGVRRWLRRDRRSAIPEVAGDR